MGGLQTGVRVVGYEKFFNGLIFVEGEKRQPELDIVRLNQILDQELATFYTHVASPSLFVSHIPSLPLSIYLVALLGSG